MKITKNQFKAIPLLLSTALLFTACNTSAPFDATKNFQGVWEHKGYGSVISIKNKQAKVYEYTRGSCLKESELDALGLKDYIAKITLSDNKKSFSINKSPVFKSSYHKIEALPTFCQDDKLQTGASPTQVFEHLWHTFNDYYAFFEERNVNWAQQYAMYRPQVTDNMSDDALFEVLKEMLEPIDDGHVNLSSDNESFSPESNIRFHDVLIEAFDQQTEFTDLNAYLQDNLQRITLLPRQYVHNIKSTGGKNKDAINWGIIDGDIGYISLNRMIIFDERFTPDDLDDLTDNDAKDDIEALNKILDTIMDDLSNTRALVIDLRLNGGGYDRASFAIANRFATQRQLVLSKYAKSKTERSETVHAYLNPSDKTYTKPIALISSEMTGSAAEVFLIAMNALPHVTLVGEASSGDLSDILDKVLPNGWQMGLSNEIYLDYLGHNHEVSGVPVDINVPAFSLSDIKQSKDSALEAAINTFAR